MQQQPHHRNEAAIIIQNHCKRPLMNFLNLLMFEEISFFSLSMSHMKNLHSLMFFLLFLFQNFIFMTVANFGPLTCSIITTTRKFFTILGSVLLFGNSLIARQWFGVICVFAGLTLDSIYGKGKKKM